MATPTGQDPKSKVQSTVEHAADRAKDAASTAADRAKSAASSVGDQASHLASAARDKAGDLASTARDTASDLASSAGHRAEDATAAVGSGMQSLAGTLRQSGPSEGMLGSAKSVAAEALDSTGRYVQQEGLSGMADDLSDLIRKNPIPALFIGIGVGFLLARVTSRS